MSRGLGWVEPIRPNRAGRTLGLFIPARRRGRGVTADRQLALDLPVEQDMVELRPMTAWEQMSVDYRTLGISPRYHPFGLLRSHLAERIRATTALRELPDDTSVQVAGLVVCRQRPGTAKGITFLLLEDEHDVVNVIIYPALYEEQRALVRGEAFLIVTGRLQHRGGVINVLAWRLESLEMAHQSLIEAPPHPTKTRATGSATKRIINRWRDTMNTVTVCSCLFDTYRTIQ